MMNDDYVRYSDDDAPQDFHGNSTWKSICQNQSVPQPRPDLLTDILRARKQFEEKRRRQRRWGLAASIALGIPLLTSLLLANKSDNELVALQRFNSINQPQQLTFVVNARQSHEQVTFSLKAPAQWTFYGYQGSHYLKWSGKLNAGANLLSIPLIAHKAVAGTLVVTIRHKDAVKEYRIPVDVNRQPV